MRNLGNISRQRGGIRPGCLISILVAVVLVVGVCVGGYFWFSGMIEDQAKLAAQDDPALKEHIGDIQEIDVNWGATGAAPENQAADKDPTLTFFVFDLVGSKGSGRLKIGMTQGGEKGMLFLNGSIEKDGKSYVLETTKRAPKEDPPAAEDPAAENGAKKAPAPEKEDAPAPKK